MMKLGFLNLWSSSKPLSKYSWIKYICFFNDLSLVIEVNTRVLNYGTGDWEWGNRRIVGTSMSARWPWDLLLWIPTAAIFIIVISHSVYFDVSVCSSLDYVISTSLSFLSSLHLSPLSSLHLSCLIMEPNYILQAGIECPGLRPES